MLMASLGGETDTLWNGNSPVLQQQDTKNNLNKLSIITNSASIKTFLIKMHTHTHTQYPKEWLHFNQDLNQKGISFAKFVTNQPRVQPPNSA